MRWDVMRDFGSTYAYLPPSTESSCSAGVSSTWAGRGPQGRMLPCQGAIPGQGLGQALGLRVSFRACSTPGSWVQTPRADASRASQTCGVHLWEKRQICQTPRRQIYVVALFSLCCSVEPLPHHHSGRSSCGSYWWCKQPVLLVFSLWSCR